MWSSIPAGFLFLSTETAMPHFEAMLAAHGGRERWHATTSFAAYASIGGLLFAPQAAFSPASGSSGALCAIHRPNASFWPLPRDRSGVVMTVSWL
jgi:hypothetical protein